LVAIISKWQSTEFLKQIQHAVIREHTVVFVYKYIFLVHATKPVRMTKCARCCRGVWRLCRFERSRLHRSVVVDRQAALFVVSRAACGLVPALGVQLSRGAGWGATSSGFSAAPNRSTTDNGVHTEWSTVGRDHCLRLSASTAAVTHGTATSTSQR